MIVTFDLFSALVDTRSGASRLFEQVSQERGWHLTGHEVYDAWDRHNKQRQRTARPPTSFVDVSRAALVAAYDELGLDTTTAAPDLGRLHSSVPQWPMWPDSAETLRQVATFARVGLLSNVDNALAAQTRAHALVEPDLVLSSQRLGAFKPDPRIYHAAVRTVAPEPLIHVASSGRDVRGATEAGITVVRLVRHGHSIDPSGPRPVHEARDGRDLVDLVRGWARA